ncbi:MAG: isoaspartyl peptidase/L-asparaginase, partial [Saprospiraceae bacterium]
MERRKFIKDTGLSVAGLSILGDLINLEILKKQYPLPTVIATWNNQKAVKAAWEVLKNNGTALDAVEKGAMVPEADPEDTSVGYGGFPDREGIVTLDACIMDHKGNAGSVFFLEGILHPISVARLVMEKTPHVYLAGEGAKLFAIENGFKEVDLLTDKAKASYETWKLNNKYVPKIDSKSHDTIGILALDGEGRLSGACTTSGLAYK